MQLFQSSVLKQHLASLAKDDIAKAFEHYKSNFLPKVENIKTMKEEQYQSGFLSDIFVDILGYTLSPNENYNLTSEQKNLSDSKKADAAVLKDAKVIPVIELKSSKTKSMDNIVEHSDSIDSLVDFLQNSEPMALASSCSGLKSPIPKSYARSLVSNSTPLIY